MAVGEALNNAARESMDVKVKFNRIGKFIVIRVRDGGSPDLAATPGSRRS